MKPIPSDLLAKLANKIQTLGNNSDPRLYLVIHRTERYIEQGGILVPRTVYDTPPAESLSSWDLAIRRGPELYKTFPDYIYRAYIDAGTIYVERTPYASMIEALTRDDNPDTLEFEWEDLSWSIPGGATEVAIEFDGYWVRTAKDADICFDSPARWTHVTTGEPWVFWVDSTGALKSQQGSTGSPGTLAADNVTKISAIRGWKSAVITHLDQGLIIGYIRSGTIRYRNYAEQETSPPTWLWESEKDTTVLAVDLGLSRTNDYRTVILYETAGGEIHWLVTKRDWAQMAIEDEQIYASITDLEVELTPVYFSVIGPGPFETDDPDHQNEKGYYGEPDEAEKMEASITALPTLFLWAEETLPVTAENILSEAPQLGEELGLASGGDPLDYQMMWAPVKENSETIQVGGVTQTRGTDYTVNYTTGVVSFVVDPAPAVVKADYIWHSWGHMIRVTFNHGITNAIGHQVQVAVKNEDLTAYACTETAAGEPWATPIPPGRFIGTRQWHLKTANFNPEAGGAQSDLTVDYTANGLQGEAEQQVGSFSLTFTPVNLIEPLVSTPAPEVEDLWNE